MFAVRHSRFRNIYGEPKKKEQCFDQIKLQVKGAEPPLAAVNGKYLAVLINCSTVDVMIRPLDQVGRVESDPKGIKSASSLTTCFEWCTRDDNLLLIGQQNGEINLIRIPEEGFLEPISTDEAELKWNCENGSVLSAVWHPTVANAVLTSCGSRFAGLNSSADTHLILWNTINTEKLIDIELSNCHLTSLSFNYNGSKVVCTDNNHITRIVELRECSPILQEAMLHKKARRQNTVYLKNGLIFSTGYSQNATREYALWDENDLSTPIELVDLDSNSGILYPIYDADINVLYVWGKGDSAVSFFEVVNEDKPSIQYLNSYQSSKPQSGIVAMPKLGVNVPANEITRLFKFYSNGFCEVIPIICPRREQGFSEEIFPPTPSREGSLTIDEWMSGIDVDPILISLESGEPSSTSNVSLTDSVHIQRPKNSNQKINEIISAINQFSKNCGPNEPNLPDYKLLLDNIKDILGMVNSKPKVTNENVVESKSEKKLQNSLHQYESTQEKKGLLNAVETFVKQNVADNIEHHDEKEWDE